MIALPVSGVNVTLRRPAGEDDILLCEAPRRDMDLTVRLLSRLACAKDCELRCAELPVTDVEVLLLELRRLLFGDVIRGDAVCPAEGCGTRVDVMFDVREYMMHHAPRAAGTAQRADEDGWFTLSNAAVRFRVPLASDRVAVDDQPDADRRMIARCVDPPELPTRLLGRVARALAALAPPLADVVQGICPECNEVISIYFDPLDFALRELRGEASHVFEEIHLLASRYHWAESEIFVMPHSRRRQYVDLIRDEVPL